MPPVEGLEDLEKVLNRLHKALDLKLLDLRLKKIEALQTTISKVESLVSTYPSKELLDLKDVLLTIIKNPNDLNARRIAYQKIAELSFKAKALSYKDRSKLGSRLIQLGILFIAFPEPAISDVIGVSLVAAGTVIMKIS